MTIANGDDLDAPSALAADGSYLLWGDDDVAVQNITDVFQRHAQLLAARPNLAGARNRRGWHSPGGLQDRRPGHQPTAVPGAERRLLLHQPAPGRPAAWSKGQLVYSVDLATSEYFSLALNPATQLAIQMPGNGAGTVAFSPDSHELHQRLRPVCLLPLDPSR